MFSIRLISFRFSVCAPRARPGARTNRFVYVHARVRWRAAAHGEGVASAGFVRVLAVDVLVVKIVTADSLGKPATKFSTCKRDRGQRCAARGAGGAHFEHEDEEVLALGLRPCALAVAFRVALVVAA